MDQRSLYFVAVLPDEESAEAFRSLQEEMCALFDVCRALRTPPHLTIVPPFKAHSSKEPKFEKALREILFEPFEMRISGFSRFGRRVIFVQPEQSVPLAELHERAANAFSKWHQPETGKPFNPHFTIGYRDLEPVFRSAWPHFREKTTPDHIRIEKMVLFKHVDRRWQVLCDIF